MKFWQLLDIFRDEKDVLTTVFSKWEWQNYRYQYSNLKQIIKNQDRSILDAMVDNDLLIEIASKSKKVVYYSESKNKIYSYRSDKSDIEIPISKAISIFKHDSLEEVFEKSESEVPYLNSFNFKQNTDF